MENKDQQLAEVKEKKIIKRVVVNQIPQEILENKALTIAINALPKNYNFEIHKSIWRIDQLKKELKKDKLRIMLQFPEGLLMFSLLINDIIEEFSNSECIIAGDVTYGACCIDDLSAQQLKCDFLIHYGHSCLIPINETVIKTLYIFIEIDIDRQHFTQTLFLNFPNLKQETLTLMGTVQFNSVMSQLKSSLEAVCIKVSVPQVKPRSQGEVLGCTSPILPIEADTNNRIVFICDGRFHMEAAMIANPLFQFYQYNPYNKQFTKEAYDQQLMIKNRSISVQACQNKRNVCVVLGILGRQGSEHILSRIESELQRMECQYFVLLVSELSVDQLKIINHQVDYFVQLACPRLSIDWGQFFEKPLLNSYEFFSLAHDYEWKQDYYPMDFYSNEGGVWSSYYHKAKPQKRQKKIKIDYEDNCQKNTCNGCECK